MINNNNHNKKNNYYNNRKSKDEPLVSIHLPIYNEQNVIDRLMKACTSLDYRNYEVVVVDDSTDETVKILEENWSNHPRVKIVRRPSRKGFKGGALNVALENMDPGAEYVLVFDADFIPPPDIIQQFLWYFENPNYRNNQNLNRLKRHKDEEEALVKALEEWYRVRETAAVQGYQWHYLNSSENWLTKGIRVEYSASYMIERTCQEALGSMKMIAGSVFMVRADVLKKYGWSTSLTEDWELTLRMYMDGYKVLYTPLIQAPGECPSTFRRLVRQRTRWAEGHSFNVKKYFWKILNSPKLRRREKFEFATYHAPYYLQSLLFCVGTLFWFLSEVLHTYLPFWISVFGWSLVLTNLISLPLMGLAGLFLERSVKKDAAGILSFIVMSYVLASFMAYASIKGLLEKKEGVWFRTFKTGKITEVIRKLELRKIMRAILPRRKKKEKATVKAEKKKGSGKKSLGLAFILLIVMSTMIFGITALSTTIVTAATVDPRYYLHDTNTPAEVTTNPGKMMDATAGTSATTLTLSYADPNRYWYTAVYDWGSGTIDPGTYTFNLYFTPPGATTLYMHQETDPSLTSYYQLKKATPDQTTAKEVTFTGTAQDKLAATFVTPQLGITSIGAGTWTFYLWGRRSGVGSAATMFVKIYKYTGGAPSLLGTSGYTSSLSTTYTARSCTWSGSSITMGTSDRILLEVYWHITATGTYYFSFDSTSRNSRAVTPIGCGIIVDVGLTNPDGSGFTSILTSSTFTIDTTTTSPKALNLGTTTESSPVLDQKRLRLRIQYSSADLADLVIKYNGAVTSGSETNLEIPNITIPENLLVFLLFAPVIPFISRKSSRKKSIH